MAQLTRAQLIDQLAASHQSYQALEARCALLQARVDKATEVYKAQRDEIAALKAAKPAGNRRPAYVAPANPERAAAHAAFRAKCEAARALARERGATVLLGAAE